MTPTEALKSYREAKDRPDRPDLLLKAAEGLYEALERFTWRSIETAPKDGSYVLIARAGEDIGVNEPVEVAAWWEVKTRNFEPVGERDLYRKVEIEEFSGLGTNGHRATHWMPLPEPPEDDYWPERGREMVGEER